MLRIGILRFFIALYIIGGSLLSSRAQTVMNWGSLGFVEDQAIAAEVDTYVDNVNYGANPYHGLATSTGGVGGWLFQSFDNVGGSGTTLTIHQSLNSTDAYNLEGASVYGQSGGDNPDCRVTGINTLRVNNDKTGTITPVTVVLSFSEPVTIQEFIVGSLSQIAADQYENIVVRAFTGQEATGATVAAATYTNISDLGNDITLSHGQGDPGCLATDNLLANVIMAPASANQTFRVIGANYQSDNRYGRVKWSWDFPIQSIAISTWLTSSNLFTENNYVAGWHSILMAPVTFTPVSTFPVEWLDFAVTAAERDAELNWTAIETGNDYYIVERSVDARAFESVGRVDATGADGEVLSYTFVDPRITDMGASRVQYRLRQVDYDGNFSYSSIVELIVPDLFKGQIALSIFPNPASDKVQFRYESASDLPFECEIRSMHGQLIRREYMHGGGSGIRTVDVSGWVPGLYMVQLHNMESTTTAKLLVR